VFALAPEFDLCKLHFSLLENDVDLGLDAFAEVVGPIYGVSASTVEASLLCFYPLMLFRLFAWGAARNHELLMLNIARAARRLMPSLQ